MRRRRVAFLANGNNQIANTQKQKKDHAEKQLAVVMVDGGGVR